MERDIVKRKEFVLIKKKKGLTGYKISKEFGFPKSTVYSWIDKYQNPNIDEMTNNPTRTKMPVDLKTRKFVIKLRNKWNWGPVRIEGFIRETKPNGIHPICHNKIHDILVEEGLNFPIDFDNPNDRVTIFLYEKLLAEHISKATKEKFSEIRGGGYTPITSHLLYASPRESKVPFNLAGVIFTVPEDKFSKICCEVSDAHFIDGEERILEEVTKKAKEYMKENGANNFLIEYRPLDEEVLESIEEIYKDILHP